MSNFQSIPSIVIAQYPQIYINVFENFRDVMNEMNLQKKIQMNLERPKLRRYFNHMNFNNLKPTVYKNL